MARDELDARVGCGDGATASPRAGGGGDGPVRSARRLDVRLPLSIAALLLVVVGVVAGIAYYELRREASASANARLRDVAHRLADITSRSTTLGFQESAKFCGRAEVRAAFAPDADPAKTHALLDPLVAHSPSGLALELWNEDETLRLVAVNEDVPDAASAGGVWPAWADPEKPSVGALRPFRGEVVLPFCCPVRDGDRVVGRLVQVRRIATTPESLKLVRDLIGENAEILMQDAQGTWTDFASIADGPPKAAETPFVYEDPKGRRWLGSAEALKDIGWTLWVRMPAGSVTSRADAFAARIGWIGAAAVLLGAFGGWLVSRRITRPLASLTRAADAMADGDLHRRVSISSRDELGVLASAFNTMADHVEASNVQLERRISDRTQELCRAVDELFASNERLNAFSYSVSHDLRAPLRAINGFGAQLLEDHGAQLDEDGRACLDRIRAAAARMEALIDDLLHLSRADRDEMRVEEVDLAREALEVVSDLRAGAPERDVDVRIDPDLRVVGDPRLLRLVLQNLLGNAWKFTGGRARARIEFGAEDGPERTFFVRDDGAGFDMKHAKKLFGVFERIHSTSEFPGTGVGLAIVERIVQRHGGRVWAEAAPGKGATFRFTLPGRSEASPPRPLVGGATA